MLGINKSKYDRNKIEVPVIKKIIIKLLKIVNTTLFKQILTAFAI